MKGRPWFTKEQERVYRALLKNRPPTPNGGRLADCFYKGRSCRKYNFDDIHPATDTQAYAAWAAGWDVMSTVIEGEVRR